MKSETVAVNVSGLYSSRSPVDGAFVIDCTGIEGTDCYCDEDAALQLRQALAPFGYDALHFIDTGNTHYLTLFWTEKIECPFSLLLFDHHPDIQQPRFEGLLSCGGWVRDMLLFNPNLRHVYMVGVSDSLKAEIEPFADRVSVVTEDESTLLEAEEIVRRLDISEETPLYLSIDKDVLCRCCYVTNWDQGSMTLDKLLSIVNIIGCNKPFLGVDLCGGLTDCNSMELSINSTTDTTLAGALENNIFHSQVTLSDS